MHNKITGEISTEVNGVVYQFKYEYGICYNADFKSQGYYFDTWENGKEDDFKFSFILIELTHSSYLKVIDMLAPKKYYRGKGIARSMILESKKIFNTRIISSSNTIKIYKGEKRSPDATRVWEKMQEEGLVSYDIKSDYYFTI